MTKTLIIKIKYGGLGDHLFYSHIPRIAKETKAYDKVYISNQSDFRNKDSKKLVWELNPYVDGFTEEDGINIEKIEVAEKETANFLDKVMLGFGLDDGQRFHEPEIYYQPKIIEKLRGKITYDPNYISNAGWINFAKIKKYFSKNQIKLDYQLIVIGENAIPVMDFGAFIKCQSIYDFIDVLFSAEKIYCLVTGTATLAAAIGKKATVFYTKDQNKIFRHSPNNNYIQL
jgi:hypothetical protein